ncbi:mucin-4-like [Sycon ciliatum]|uniref:mucin-4-like n=1 Tax=Sycon ciliatum TaxID=27933 RepID=UPI0031F66055
MYSTDPLLGIFRRGTCNITFSVAASKLVDGALSVYAIGARRNRTLFRLSANGTANSWQSVQAASLTLRAINETVQVQLAFATRAGGGWGHIFIDDLQISCCRETAMCKEINPLKFRTFPKRWTLGAWKISSGMQDNRSTNVFHSHENSSNPESIASYSTSPLQSAYMRGICNITFSVMASNFVDGALVVYEIATGHNRLLFNMSASQANGTGPNVHRVQSRLCPFRSFSGRMRLQLRFVTRAGGGWGDIYIDDMLIVCCRTNATKRPSNSTAAFRIGASPSPGTPASKTPSVATASARVHAKPTASPVHRAEESSAVAATLSKPSHPATQTTPTSTQTPNQTRTHAGNQTSTPTQGRATLRAPAHTKTQSPTQINAQTPAPTRTPAQTQTSMRTPLQTSDHTPLQTGDHTPLQTSDQTPLETGDHTPLHTGDHTPTQAGTELVRATPAQGNTSSASSTPPNSPQVGQDASLPSAHAPSPLPHPAHPHANTAGKKTVVPRDAKSSGGHGGNFAELVCGAAALGCLLVILGMLVLFRKTLLKTVSSATLGLTCVQKTPIVQADPPRVRNSYYAAQISMSLSTIVPPPDEQNVYDDAGNTDEPASYHASGTHGQNVYDAATDANMANVYDAAGDAVTPNAYDAAERRFHYDGLEPEDLSSGSLHCGKRGLSPPNSTSSDGPLRTASVNKQSTFLQAFDESDSGYDGLYNTNAAHALSSLPPATPKPTLFLQPSDDQDALYDGLYTGRPGMESAEPCYATPRKVSSASYFVYGATAESSVD